MNFNPEDIDWNDYSANAQEEIACHAHEMHQQPSSRCIGWLVLWCLTPLSTIFQLYRGGRGKGLAYWYMNFINIHVHKKHFCFRLFRF